MLTTLFLRCDDLGDLSPALAGFAPVFADRNIPVSYQVIPAQLTEAGAAWVRERKATAPGLFEFGQHGHTHEMEVAGLLEFYEFGPERDLAAQTEVIAAGRRLMVEKLAGAAEPRLFTPPRHRYDRNTLLALAQQGFSILSASSYATRKHQIANRLGRAAGLTNIGRGGVSHHGRRRPEAPLIELSVAVAIDHGPPLDRDLEQVMAEISAARRATPYVGLMLHHSAWATEPKRDWLKRLADRLLALPDVRFATIGAVADELG